MEILPENTLVRFHNRSNSVPPMTKPLAALLLVCSLLMGGCVRSIWKKMHVKIENNLPGGTHSHRPRKSKDDDLGTQHLIVKGCWEFSFGPRFFLGTRFFCSFSWPGRFEWFDIYLQVRDEFVCDECTWKISPDGPCRVGKKFDACYHWNPHS